MALKPARRADRTADDGSAPRLSDRDKIIDALMTLLAEKAFETIEYAEIARCAGVPLTTLRNEFGSKLSIFAAYAKAIDRKVLEGVDADMAEEPPRERLFDVLMRRLEELSPDRGALRSLMRSARRDPALALALNGLAVKSQQWMMTAARINAAGPRGVVRAQGLALLFASVLPTFVDDEDDGSKTMAALDRALGRGERLSGYLDDLCRFVPRRGCLPRFRRRRDDRDREAGGGEAVPI